MRDLTPDEKDLLDAALIRAEEIRQQINSVITSGVPTLQQAGRLLELAREMQELTAGLEGISGINSQLGLSHADLEKAQQAIALLRRPHEPTDTELALAELTARLLAKLRRGS